MNCCLQLLVGSYTDYQRFIDISNTPNSYTVGRVGITKVIESTSDMSASFIDCLCDCFRLAMTNHSTMWPYRNKPPRDRSGSPTAKPLLLDDMRWVKVCVRVVYWNTRLP